MRFTQAVAFIFQAAIGSASELPESNPARRTMVSGRFLLKGDRNFSKSRISTMIIFREFAVFVLQQYRKK